MGHGLDRFLVFVVGAIIGSFLNVCIHRMPRKQSVIYPPSHCPKCDKRLFWYDNIPILSYAVLLGRCSFCRKKISARYPIVEILTASLIVALYMTFGISAKFFTYSALTSALIVAAFIDIDFYEIPDLISLGGLAVGLALSAIFPVIFDTDLKGVSFLSSLIGALAGGLTVYAMGVFGKGLFKKEAMGGGDVKLMAMIGSILGWKLTLFTFFVAPIFGAVVGVFLRIKDGRDMIAYGPYLSLSAIVAIFFGNKLLGFLFYGI